MKEVIQIIHNFVEDRPTLKENNRKENRHNELLEEETKEFVEETDIAKRAREGADVIWLVVSWALDNGVDIEAEIREKAARNHLKRPAYLYNNGLTYEEAEVEVKQLWGAQQENEFYK